MSSWGNVRLLFLVAFLAIAAWALLQIPTAQELQKSPTAAVDTPTPTQTTVPVLAPSCMTAGCSKELCVEASDAGNIMTPCIYRDEYACYKTAVCERQQSGQCGWTQTESLTYCLAHAMPEDDSNVYQ